jgi:hypothetical protein
VAGTVTLLQRYLRPAAVDAAAQWIAREVKGPALLVTSLPRLQLPPERFEVRLIGSLDELPMEAPPRYDLLVATTRRELLRLSALPQVAQFPSEDGDDDRPITVLRPRRGDVPQEQRPDTTTASFADPYGRLWDGDAATCWEVPSGASTMEARWNTARRIDGVELSAGARPDDWPQPIRLSGLADTGWRRLDVEPLRPTRSIRQRPGTPHGQTFLLVPPLSLAGLRVERASGPAWALCELRALAFVPAGPKPGE